MGEVLEKKDWKVSDVSKNNLLRFRLNELLISTEQAILDLRFNTAVSDFMKFVNLVNENDDELDKEVWGIFLQILNPFAPFITSELWIRSKGIDINSKVDQQIYTQKWPEPMEVEQLQDESITIVVMVNGKVRDSLQVHKGTSQDEVIQLAKKSENVQKFVEDFSKIKKQIFVQDKLINLVV